MFLFLFFPKKPCIQKKPLLKCLNYMYMWVSVCVYVHVNAGTQEGQICQIPLELELQVV